MPSHLKHECSWELSSKTLLCSSSKLAFDCVSWIRAGYSITTALYSIKSRSAMQINHRKKIPCKLPPVTSPYSAATSLKDFGRLSMACPAVSGLVCSGFNASGLAVNSSYKGMHQLACSCDSPSRYTSSVLRTGLSKTGQNQSQRHEPQ